MIRKFFLFGLIAFVCSSCLVGRFAWYNFSNITDHKIFPSRALTRDETPFQFNKAPERSKVFISKLDSLNKANRTVAFLIIRNDSILTERYYDGYNSEDWVASFSMAKSYTSALIGAAIADGYIKSVDEPVINYIPEWKSEPGMEKITLRQVLLMTSGIQSNESYYNPFGQAARLYYGRNLENYVLRLKPDYTPGTKFAYRSMNTQILGLVLERAVKKDVTTYMNEKIWSHLGAEYPASWSIDKKNPGLEKTFCCINATARDFAKFGRLFLHHGNWNGTQILPESWVKESTARTTTDGAAAYYAYQWWLTPKAYYANGLHGQYIYVNEAKNLIIVRLGREGKINFPAFFDELSTIL